MCSIPASVTPVSVWCSAVTPWCSADGASASLVSVWCSADTASVTPVSVWCVADVDSHSSVARCVPVSLLVIPNVYMHIKLMSPTLN